MASKQYVCIKGCHRRNPAGLFKLYDLGNTEWFDPEKDKPSPKHWVESQPGQVANAYETLRQLCISVGVEPNPKWDILRLQREYEHVLDEKRKENDKRVMQSTVPQADGDVTGRSVMPPEKGKKR